MPLSNYLATTTIVVLLQSSVYSCVSLLSTHAGLLRHLPFASGAVLNLVDKPTVGAGLSSFSGLILLDVIILPLSLAWGFETEPMRPAVTVEDGSPVAASAS